MWLEKGGGGESGGQKVVGGSSWGHLTDHCRKCVYFEEWEAFAGFVLRSYVI